MLLLAALLAIAPARPAEAQGAIGFNPGVGTIPDGVGLGVTPVVSADRRYVRLSIGANFSTINGFSNFPVAGAVSGGGALGGGLGGAPGGFRNINPGPGLADQGVPYNLEYLEASRKAAAQGQAKPAAPDKAPRGKKALADPVMVPMKKGKPKANAPRG